MYEAFDRFLAVSTWYTKHPNDEERFFHALRSVVRNDLFSPDALGDYIRQKAGVSRDDGHPYNDVIDDYVAAAWAVKDYLKATGE